MTIRVIPYSLPRLPGDAPSPGRPRHDVGSGRRGQLAKPMGQPR